LNDPRDATTEAAGGPGDHLPVLDGLRGVAILIVFLNHAIAQPLEPATRIDAAVRAMAYSAGWTGIDLFFVLSGFLITGILLDTKDQPRRWSNFVVRRALRIFPLYYGALTILFVVLPRLVHWSEPAFTTLQVNQRWYWTYTVNVLTALTRDYGTPLYTTHFWSLSIEEQFYLAWPLVVWACTPRGLLRVAALTVIGGVAFRLGLVLQGNVSAAYFLTPGRLDSLMCGAALAVVARMPGGLGRLRALAAPVLGASVIAVGLLAMLRGGLYLNDPVVALAAYPMVALLYGALLVMALTGRSSSCLVRMLRRAWLGKWGKYSYGIYVVHFPLIGVIRWKTTFYLQGAALLGGSRLPSVLLLAAVTMSLSYTFAWLSYHIYEKRFLALKRYFPSQPAVRDVHARGPQTEVSRGSPSFG